MATIFLHSNQIVKNRDEIPQTKEWNDATGTADTNVELNGRKYKIISNKQTPFRLFERIARAAIGVFAVAITLGLALIFKPVRQLFTAENRIVTFVIDASKNKSSSTDKSEKSDDDDKEISEEKLSKNTGKSHEEKIFFIKNHEKEESSSSEDKIKIKDDEKSSEDEEIKNTKNNESNSDEIKNKNSSDEKKTDEIEKSTEKKPQEDLLKDISPFFESGGIVVQTKKTIDDVQNDKPVKEIQEKPLENEKTPSQKLFEVSKNVYLNILKLKNENPSSIPKDAKLSICFIAQEMHATSNNLKDILSKFTILKTTIETRLSSSSTIFSKNDNDIFRQLKLPQSPSFSSEFSRHFNLVPGVLSNNLSNDDSFEYFLSWFYDENQFKTFFAALQTTADNFTKEAENWEASKKDFLKDLEKKNPSCKKTIIKLLTDESISPKKNLEELKKQLEILKVIDDQFDAMVKLAQELSPVEV